MASPSSTSAICNRDGHRHVHRGATQTRGKCRKEAERYWAGGHSVVTDNTYPAAVDRQALIDIVQRVSSAKKTGTAAADSAGVGVTAT